MPRPLSDDEAWIVSHNLRLVDYYLRGRRCDDATRDELQAAGYLGLCCAIRRFDPAKAAWSTYATRWIRRCIQQETRERSLVHVPVYHRSSIKSGSNPASKRRYGGKAASMMAAHAIQWHEGEAVAVLAVTPATEPTDERYRIIEDYLLDLPAEDQTLVRRVTMKGERVADVARDIGISAGRAEQIRRRAIRILRYRLAEEWPGLVLP